MSEDPNASVSPEARWLAETYQGNKPQLTVRAVLVGMMIGAVMCLSNLYVFFKTGWSMGVTITAAILAFAVFKGLGSIRFRSWRLIPTPLSALENNALSTVSSGAGFMTGGGNMAAFGALMMVTSVRPPQVPMIAWFGAIAALGVFTAIPIKRQLINAEGLAFPTGKATAETLRAIHGEGAHDGAVHSPNEGTAQARALGLGALFAAVLAWFRDAKAWWMPFNIPAQFGFPFTLGGKPAIDWTLALKAEVVMFGAGALMSFRTAWSLLLGGLLTYGALAPSLFAHGLIHASGYKNVVGWTVWPGAAILVASGLTSFALDWRSVGRSFSGIAQIFAPKREGEDDPMDAIECPGWWFPAGFVVLGPIVVLLMTTLFQIPWWAGVIAVPLAVVMGFIAARVTGETDVTPTKALGPVTQLLYGVITPGNLSGNIMSANVTGGIGLHAADLLTTLKTGWLLGAKPRVQFYAQLFGVLAGAAVVVPAFNILIPDPSVLGSDTWPAPSCLIWAGVSKAFAGGIGTLGQEARMAIVYGAILGVALVLFERVAPKALRNYIPSPAGLGIAMVVPGSNAIAMFLGALIALIVNRASATVGRRYVVPVASGLIAGESLMGVAIAMLIVAGVLRK